VTVVVVLVPLPPPRTSRIVLIASVRRGRSSAGTPDSSDPTASRDRSSSRAAASAPEP
jgi:hypothetical protein